MDVKVKAALADVAHELHTAILADDDAVARQALGDAMDTIGAVIHRTPEKDAANEEWRTGGRAGRTTLPAGEVAK